MNTLRYVAPLETPLLFLAVSEDNPLYRKNIAQFLAEPFVHSLRCDLSLEEWIKDIATDIAIFGHYAYFQANSADHIEVDRVYRMARHQLIHGITHPKRGVKVVARWVTFKRNQDDLITFDIAEELPVPVDALTAKEKEFIDKRPLALWAEATCRIAPKGGTFHHKKSYPYLKHMADPTSWITHIALDIFRTCMAKDKDLLEPEYFVRVTGLAKYSEVIVAVKRKNADDFGPPQFTYEAEILEFKSP